uniref:OSJNBa0096F01.21 protein n=1 Tax=Oryza sativa subsp. japonica TaxID=39947 RepID=Q5JQE7_ORYSJ|nr:OSJNBa0096F01.21 [Oryza sativa Japonica Group]
MASGDDRAVDQQGQEHAEIIDEHGLINEEYNDVSDYDSEEDELYVHEMVEEKKRWTEDPTEHCEGDTVVEDILHQPKSMKTSKADVVTLQALLVSTNINCEIATRNKKCKRYLWVMKMIYALKTMMVLRCQLW